MSIIRRYLPEIAIILLLFALPLGFFFPQTLGGQTLIPTENIYQYEPYRVYRDVVNAPEIPQNHLVSDLVLQNFQWKSFTRDQLAQGEVPLWNPHQFGGIPFLAAGQHSALYPVSAVYYLLDLPVAYGWYTVINLWLAGVFMFAFMRGLGVGRMGAVLAGVIYQFNGFVLASVVFQMMIGAYVWMPLFLLMAEFIMRDKTSLNGQSSAIPWVAIGSIALGMNILAGHVEITLYTLLIAGYYCAIRLGVAWWRNRTVVQLRPTENIQPVRILIRHSAWLLVMVSLGLGLGALQFIPLFEFVQTNWRAERSSLELVLSFAHPMRDVLQFVMPNFYGSPAIQSYINVISGETITQLTNSTGESINFIEWGIKNYVEGALYLGILPLILSLYALWDRWFLWRRDANRPQTLTFRAEPPYRTIFASLGALSVTFMFGLPTYALIYALPGFNQLNSPFRWIYALMFAVAVLSAFGLDALMRRASVQGGKTARQWGQAITGLGIFTLAGLLISQLIYSSIEPTLDGMWQGLVNAPNSFADTEAFYSLAFWNALIFAGALCISGVIFWSVGRLRAYKGYTKWSAIAIAFVVVDLMIASWGFNPASDPALLDFTPPEVEFMLQREAEGDRFRVTTLETDTPIFNANLLWRYGIDDIRGYDSIIGLDTVNYMRDMAVQGQLDFNRIAPLFAQDFSTGDDGLTIPDNAYLNLLNVRYIYAPIEVQIDISENGWRKVQDFPTLSVYENTHAVPRVFSIDADDFERDVVAVPEDYTEQLITRDSGREKFVDVTFDHDSWLIISEMYADGWRAFVRPLGAGEGEETAYPVEQVLQNLQGVQLPAGEWTVRLVYSPPSFQIGLFGSIISVASVTLLVGMWLWRVFVGVNDESSSATARVARNSIAPIILNLFNRGIDFAFLLVMLRLLSPEDVGIYYYLVVIFGWFDIFTNFGLDLFLIREVSRDKSRAGHYFFNTTLLRLGLTFVGIALVFGFILIRQNTIDPALPDYALLSLGLLYVGLFPASLSKGMTSLFYAFEQAEKPAAIATITSINKAIFGVIALMLGYGIVGLAGVSIINNIITFTVLVWTGRELIGHIKERRPDGKLWRTMRIEGLPLMFNHFLQTIFFQIDIIILEAIKGVVVVAQYSIAYKWILALNVIPAFFTQALLPVMSRQAQEDKEALKRTYTLGLKMLTVLTFPCAVVFTAWAEPLTFIMGGQQYLPAGAIAIQLMIWSIPIGWMNSLTQYVLVALDMQRLITRAFIVAVVFNITANLIFIPQFSYQAAAITTIFSELALWIPFIYYTQKGLGSRLAWNEILLKPIFACAVMIGVIVIGWAIQPFIAVIVGGLVYIAVMIALKPLNADERAMLPERVTNSRIGQVLLGV